MSTFCFNFETGLFVYDVTLTLRPFYKHTIANFMSHMKVKKLTLNKATSSSLRSFIDNPKADLKNYSVNLIVRFVLYRIYLNHWYMGERFLTTCYCSINKIALRDWVCNK